jgi:S1-C subfamily serine protease
MNITRNLLVLSSVALFSVAAVIYGYAAYDRRQKVEESPVKLADIARIAEPASAPDAEETEAVRVFKTCKDSVVNVDTIVRVRRFDMSVQEQQTGTGSGFVWDDAGHIVTNFHVVRDAVGTNRRLRVVLADRSTWEARIVGVSPDHDLAVLKIVAGSDRFKKIRLGKSSDLEVGHKVYAIGNPFGLSLSMTKGIVSALEREIDSPSERTIGGVIQTDAPINPGNSGGPLLNKDGLLIGVNTAIKTPSGGNVGIGFAIPVDTVAPVVVELITRGKVLQPDLGIKLVDQWRVRRAGVPTGVMIQSVEEDSPASEAGLRGVVVKRGSTEAEFGDVIVAINGKEVKGNSEFNRMLGAYKIGETLKLTVERNDSSREVEVTLRGM